MFEQWKLVGGVVHTCGGMMKRLLPPILLLGLFASLALPGMCLACSCVIALPDQALARADVVFRGQLITFSQRQVARYKPDGAVEQLTTVRAVFLVDTGWKGEIAPVLSVYKGEIAGGGRMSGSTCAASLQLGREYLVFASRGNFGRDYPTDLLSTGGCAGTREAGEAGDYLAALGPGTPVAQGPSAQSVLATGIALAALDLALSAGPQGAASPPPAPRGRVPSTFAEFGFMPSAVASDRQGNVYVSDIADRDYKRHRILKYSPSGQLVAAWGGTAGGTTVGGPGQFYEPSGIAVDTRGHVYVADRISGVQKLDPTGQPVPGWPTRADALKGIQFPHGLATDGQDNLYITAIWGNTVHKFSATGEPLAVWGEPGSEPGQFRSPNSVTVDANGDIYIADAGNHRIQKLSPAGAFLLQWGSRGAAVGEFDELYGVALDRQGNIYVADRGNNRVQQFTGDGRPIGQWGGEGSALGQFRRPWGVAAGPLGEIYVADMANYRIQRLPALGQP